MGRYTGPKNKIARRFGVNLGLKTNAAKVAKRLNQKPGQHGARRRSSTSSFGKQLEEKQKAKFIYGLRERQFRGYVEEANRREGDSGVNLNKILESRLDNVIYRMGFAVTRAQARQFVNHAMFTVNGKKLNIPSYLTKVGDEIALRDNKQGKKIFEPITDQLSNAKAPSWLKVDPSAKKGSVLSAPLQEEVENVFDVKLIIEYYSTR
ncbi:MAG: 30S ribosomal protein S4 [Candidatus Magasanikbacteria bacterium CG1_02_41_34]|uniref:Small ribosomal subunit protein uS4 n=1 Tax=Candidatus Magasanikbacteria bacterium CG_4_10_14_0_2_um_filter_41_31 TaxID=1974639 RepID=A0A2M7V1U1_9BACT|nr:MAG: 30S ribosomal protein S4 [Candidatus Magasanikbacteria bacterium CG1_02_41_34]PIZ92323.1 MAG: 30S ribosomal protein S4 [Candidatus Magasanikbacteria bacterium CG_4_10_14_0_2_um_filter_41_31]